MQRVLNNRILHSYKWTFIFLTLVAVLMTGFTFDWGDTKPWMVAKFSQISSLHLVVDTLIKFMSLGSLFIAALLKPASDEIFKTKESLLTSIKNVEYNSFRLLREKYISQLTYYEHLTSLRFPFSVALILVGIDWVGNSLTFEHTMVTWYTSVGNLVFLFIGVVILALFGRFLFQSFLPSGSVLDAKYDLTRLDEFCNLVSTEQIPNCLDLFDRYRPKIVVNKTLHTVTVQWPSEWKFKGDVYVWTKDQTVPVRLKQRLGSSWLFFRSKYQYVLQNSVNYDSTSLGVLISQEKKILMVSGEMKENVELMLRSTEMSKELIDSNQHLLLKRWHNYFFNKK